MGIDNQLGSFSWFSLMTNDTAKATKFYQDLLGWKTTDMEIPGSGTSTLFEASGLTFANPVALEGKEANIPSHWISWVAVADLDQSLSRVQSMGGKTLVPTFEIPTVGKTAVVADPLGAPFHLYMPESKDTDLNVIGNKPGQVCWMELMVDDPSKVIPFYAELFGWKIGETHDMGGGKYTGFSINGETSGGFMSRPPHVPAHDPCWMPYFTVEKIGPATERAKELGAKTMMEGTEIPDTGWFTVFGDPTGAHAYLFEYNPALKKS